MHLIHAGSSLLQDPQSIFIDAPFPAASSDVCSLHPDLPAKCPKNREPRTVCPPGDYEDCMACGGAYLYDLPALNQYREGQFACDGK
jgi:hypothetical protein